MKITYLFFLLLFPTIVFGQDLCESTGSGDWQSDANWTCGHVPFCGDSIIINPGHTIEITSQLNYESCPSMFLYVDGTLEFTNGNKLQLPCGSDLVITPTGLVHKPGNGAGNSTLLEICDTTVWKAADGDFYGPYNYGGALPITLVDYWIESDARKNIIQWSTATETDADYFRISKSTDGYQFKEIGEVPSHGNSTSLKKYSLEDRNPSYGVSYYKLEAFDLDGSMSYSEIKSMEYINESDAIIYPNPLQSDKEINIQYNKDVSINRCEIINTAGQVVPASVEIEDRNISIQGIKTSGIYIINVYFEQTVLQHKIVVQ